MNNMKQSVRELLGQAQVLYSVGKNEEALTLLKQAQTQDPYCEKTYELMTICCIMMDKYKEARKLLEKYLLVNKKSSMAYFHLGNIALLEEKPEEAKAFYSKAELLGCSDRMMYINMASYFEDNDQPEKAIEQYNKLLRVDPYDYDTMERKTNLLMRTADFEAALNAAREMVKTDIDRFEGHHFVYIALIMLEKYEDAQTYIASALERFPDNNTLKFDCIRLFDLVGEPEKALGFLDTYFPTYDAMPQAATMKLGLLLQSNRPEEAIAFAAANPALQEDSAALTILYTLYFGAGDYEKAIEVCEKIERLNEKTSEYYATQYFKPLAVSKVYGMEKAHDQFAKAADTLRDLCAQNPGALDLYMYRALCAYQLAEYAEAKRILEYLIAVAPDEASFYLAAALVYDACGDSQEAQEARQKAQELDPNMVAPLV